MVPLGEELVGGPDARAERRVDLDHALGERRHSRVGQVAPQQAQHGPGLLVGVGRAAPRHGHHTRALVLRREGHGPRDPQAALRPEHTPTREGHTSVVRGMLGEIRLERGRHHRRNGTTPRPGQRPPLEALGEDARLHLYSRCSHG